MILERPARAEDLDQAIRDHGFSPVRYSDPVRGRREARETGIGVHNARGRCLTVFKPGAGGYDLADATRRLAEFRAFEDAHPR